MTINRTITKTRAELVRDARDCLKIMATSLRCWEAGEEHMYKVLAAQLRILFCDKHHGKDNSLTGRLCPVVALPAFKQERWSEPVKAHGISVQYGTEFPDHLTIAKDGDRDDMTIELDSPLRPIGREEWLEQTMSGMTVRMIVEHIADKDGGAHCDDDITVPIQAMKDMAWQKTPVHIVALSRCVLEHLEPTIANLEKGCGV